MRETDYLKENKKALDLLRRIERFQAFSDEDLDSFLAVGKLKEYEPGETIIKKGDVDHWVFFLVSGEVKVVKGEQTFAILKRSGDLFGEMGVIDGSPRSASVWAMTKTMVLGLDLGTMHGPKTEFANVFHYTIFRLFAESLAERLRLTNEAILRLQEKIKEKDAIIAKLSKDSQTETMWL